MQDHAHALVTGRRQDSDFMKWIKHWRQMTSYEFKQRTGRPLWQEDYWDKTLRSDVSVYLASAYIVGNPVRKGLVERAEDYPYSGSQTYSMKEMSDFVAESDKRPF